MTTKCTCSSSSTHLAFESENAGETIACPHCGEETLLFIPEAPVEPRRQVEETERTAASPPSMPEPAKAKLVDQFVLVG